MPFTLNVQSLILLSPDIYHISLVSQKDTVLVMGNWAPVSYDPPLSDLYKDFLLVMGNRNKHASTSDNKKKT